MRDELPLHLARHARALGLNEESLPGANEDDLRSFCGLVLRELAARGLLPAAADPGCHATPGNAGN